MIEGSTPTDDQDTIRANGSSRFFRAKSSFIIVTAAAPSFNPDAFPAETVRL